MKVQLFIENQEIELNNSVQFCLNKQFEELSNPTTIINDWSKTVSIPFTAHNNKVFGYIYKPERLIVNTNNPNSYKLMGIYFDPTKKLDFRLIYNTVEIMSGYAKMNEIKQSKGKGTYEITLYGLLGKIFQEMQKITFDESTDEPNYLINGSDYVSTVMNKNLICNCWNTDHLTTSILKKRTDSGYNITDIIGFAPNNSISEGFDYKTYQYTNSSTSTFEKTLEERSFEAATGISAGTIIPNGMLPREIGEYRSYLQLPFIYFNKLFKIFQAKAEQVTGYTFDLDTNWFQTMNPYWYRLVYMLKGFTPKNGNDFANTYKVSGTTISSSLTYNADGGSDYSPRIIGDSWHDGGFVRFSIINESLPVMESNVIHLPQDGILKFTDIPIQFSFSNTRDTVSGTHFTNFRLNDGHYPSFEISLYDENGNYISNSKKVIGLTYSGREVPASDLSTLGIDEIAYTNDNAYCGWGDTYTYSLMLPYNKSFTYSNSATYKMKIRYKWNNISNTNHIPFASYTPGSEPTFNLAGYCAPLVLKVSQSTNIPVEIIKGLTRSGVIFTLNTLWNKDFKIFDEIVKYCKMYRILIKVDEYLKKIKFIHQSTYFKNYSIVDWTDKLDISKDFTIAPVAFDNKYVLFNYKDSKTKLATEYKENYGINFGEYRLSTDYNFNTETSNLFKDIPQSMVNTDNILSWNNIYGEQKIFYSFPNELSVYCKDKDNKFQDCFGSYYFHTGLGSFNTEEALNLRTVYISDDTTLQTDKNTYCYNQQTSLNILPNGYTKLDVVYGNNMCVFNIPKANYTYNNNYGGKSSIYSNFWDEYLDERYNILNKKVTCYLKLTPQDWNNFDFNKFIIINNQIYMVNKIYDYDLTTDIPTKVDLITVQDINGYCDDSFFSGFVIYQPIV